MLPSLLYENCHEFAVKHHKDTNIRKHIVVWDGKKATCSYKHFKFWKILCRRILCVFLRKDCYKILSMYLPLRWLDEEDLVDKTINDDVHCPPISKTEGRSKTKRMKGGKEIAGKLSKSCGLCKKVGHNITTCLEKENIGHTNNSQKRKKKNKISSSDVGLNPCFL